MSNMIKRGRGSVSYWENASLAENIFEPLNPDNTALTGSLAWISGSRTINGTGTQFQSELKAGQWVLGLDTVNHKSFLFAVTRVVSATQITVARAPTTTVSGMTGYRTPVLFALDNQRGAALRGNVIRYDKGTLFGVGAGVFFLDGLDQVTQFMLSNRPSVGVLSSGVYAGFELGLPEAGSPTVTAVSGGSKGMQAAKYSLVVTRERVETVGYGNPSLPAEFELTSNGQRVSIDFGNMDAASGQNGWGVWSTRFADFQDALGRNYLEGPWFRVRVGSGPNGMITAADLSGTTFIGEWLDAELEGENTVDFDNDPPPDAEFVAVFNNVPVWISCDGVNATNPGIRIYPAKPSNPEAAPVGLSYPTSPPEEILGVHSALGRLYLLTSNHLQVALGTGRDNLPLIIQPFWKAGFRNAYQLDSVHGWLYGCTTAGPGRSIGEGDQQETDRSWAWPITEYTKDWVMDHVMNRYDPVLDAMCYFESAHNLNAQGYWTTRVWCFGLEEQEWVADILLSSPYHDCIVSGVATVGAHLEFLMGGRARSTISYFIYSVFTGTLARRPTGTEFSTWETLLNAATTYAALLAQAKLLIEGLFYSAEYAARQRSDSEFVEDCYHGFLNRPSEAAGKAFHLIEVATFGRAYVVNAFGNSPEFQSRIAGLMAQAETVLFNTYRFETGNDPVSWHFAPVFSDSGDSQRVKNIGPGVYVSGKVTRGKLKFYVAGSRQTIPVTDLEDGVNPRFSIPVDNDGVLEGGRRQLNVRNAKLHTVRLEGTWDGVAEKDRIEDINYEAHVYGARR